MNKKNIITAVKEMFTSVNDTVTETFVDVKTADGLILRMDDIAPEMKIQEVTEDGLAELENGEYVLEDGITLVVEDGLIKEILEATQEDMEETVEEIVTEEMSEEVIEETIEETEFAEVTDEEVPTEPVTPETEEEGEYVSVEVFAAHMDEVKSMFDELKAEIEALKSDKAVAMSELEGVKEAFSAFKGEPSAKPLNKTYDFSTLSKDDKLKALRR